MPSLDREDFGFGSSSPGTVVKGKVTRTADYGAFVELEPGVEGMVHISELSPQRVQRVTQVVKAGDEVTVKVLSLDVPGRRMSLSIKAALKAPEPEPTAAVEPEKEGPAPKVKPRAANLRGGVGNKVVFEMPKSGEEKGEG